MNVGFGLRNDQTFSQEDLGGFNGIGLVYAIAEVAYLVPRQ